MKYGSLKIIMILSSLMVLATACGKNDSQSAIPAGAIPNCVGTGCVTPPGGGTPYAPPFTTGDTETLTVNPGMLQQYAGVPLNNPSNVQINIALTPSTVGSTTVYLGQMQIRYTDGPILHNGVFGNGSAGITYRGYTNNVNSQVTPGNYRIFFEDAAGALVLTIHQVTGTDTSAPASGTLYFYNFSSTAPNPLYSGAYDQYGTYFPPGYVYCWMIDLGPYDCRNFNVPPTSPYTSAGTTVPGFQTLGTISTINISAALGI